MADALPSLLQPADLCWLVAGHAIEPGSLYDDFDPMQGEARKVRLRTMVPRVAHVTALVDSALAQKFEAWFEGPLQVGSGKFTTKVAPLGGDPQYWAAEWIDPPEYDAENGPGEQDIGAEHLPPTHIRWRISGSLLLTGVGSDEPPEFSELELEYSAELNGTAGLQIEVGLELEYSAELLSVTPLELEYFAELLEVVPSYFEREDSGFIERESGGTDLQRE